MDFLLHLMNFSLQDILDALQRHHTQHSSSYTGRTQIQTDKCQRVLTDADAGGGGWLRVGIWRDSHMSAERLHSQSEEEHGWELPQQQI